MIYTILQLEMYCPGPGCQSDCQQTFLHLWLVTGRQTFLATFFWMSRQTCAESFVDLYFFLSKIWIQLELELEVVVHNFTYILLNLLTFFNGDQLALFLCDRFAYFFLKGHLETINCFRKRGQTGGPPVCFCKTVC